MAAHDRVAVLDLSRYGRVWLLAVDGGDAVRAQGEPLCHGLCLPYPRPLSAVFVHDDQIWLQVGNRRWDVDTINQVRQITETMRHAEYELSINDGRVDHVDIRFPHSVRLTRRIDPTHDEIESWSEDIMKVLPYTAPDGWTADPNEDVAAWKARVLPLWRAGISPRS